MTRRNDLRKVLRPEGSGIPPKPPITNEALARYAAWPQRLRNNIGNRTIQTDDVSAQVQVIPVIEALVAEVRRLREMVADLQPRDQKYRELCWYHDVCKLPIGHIGDHETEPDQALVAQRAVIQSLILKK